MPDSLKLAMSKVVQRNSEERNKTTTRISRDIEFSNKLTTKLIFDPGIQGLTRAIKIYKEILV